MMHSIVPMTLHSSHSILLYNSHRHSLTLTSQENSVPSSSRTRHFTMISTNFCIHCIANQTHQTRVTKTVMSYRKGLTKHRIRGIDCIY